MTRFANVQPWRCTDAEYFHGDAIGSSDICRVLGKSGPTARTGNLGNANHVGILQPGRFDQRVVTPPPEVSPGSGEGQKKRMADWKEANAEKIIVSKGDYAKSLAMKKALEASPLLDPIRQRDVICERSYRATDTVTGLTVRIRPDAFTADRAETWDLKMARDPGFFSFRSAILSCWYFVQAALYVDVLGDMLGKRPAWSWLVVGSEEPHHPACYPAGDEWLEIGRRFYAAGLLSIANAKASGVGAIPWWSSKPIHMDPPPEYLNEEVLMHEQYASDGDVSREREAPIALTMGGKAISI